MTDTETTEPKRNHADSLPIEERVERYKASRQTFLQSRRMRQKLNEEYGRAANYRGAVKKSRFKKLNALAVYVHGFRIPEFAREQA